MNFRRMPFQFSSTDPVERQAELEKRFGLPIKNNMYVDVANPLSMRASENENVSSPRLQHRVPIFLDGDNQPVHSSVDSVGPNPDAQKKPNVRVIPIEVEGDYLPSSRHRTFSGPAGIMKNPSFKKDDSSLKRSVQDLSQPSKVQVAGGGGPKVHNIPIQIEDRILPIQKTSNLNIGQPFTNGCASSKDPVKSKVPAKPTESFGSIASKQLDKVNACRKSPDQQQTAEPKIENTIENSLKKIEDILKELELYESGVKEFAGSIKDKQYRYLDEMLTRCILRLDDVDTLGNDNVRSTRKSAVKKVQNCIDLLESKVNTVNVPGSGDQEMIESVDVEMVGESEHAEAENKEDGLKIGIPEVGVSENKCSQESVEVCVTEVESTCADSLESSTLVPNVIEPDEVEMSENQSGEKTSDKNKEADIEIEEVKDLSDELSEVEVDNENEYKKHLNSSANDELYCNEEDSCMEEDVKVGEKFNPTDSQVNALEINAKTDIINCDLVNTVQNPSSKQFDLCESKPVTEL